MAIGKSLVWFLGEQNTHDFILMVWSYHIIVAFDAILFLKTRVCHSKAISKDTWAQLLEFARVKKKKQDTLVLLYLHILIASMT